MSEVSLIPIEPDGVTSFLSSALHRSLPKSSFVMGSLSSPASESTTTIDSSPYSSAATEYTSDTDHTENDVTVRDQPLMHVDYLSHDWDTGNIWPSWKYIGFSRKVHSNSTRLENAIWRAWTASRYRLQRVSPETLNW